MKSGVEIINKEIRNICGNRELVIFGTSSLAETYVKRYQLNMNFFTDNDKNKWHSVFLNIKILPPNILMEHDKYFVIIASSFVDEISKQLENMGYKKNKDFVFIEQFIKNLERNCLSYDEDKHIAYNDRLLVDVTPINLGDFGTGIGRVVYNITAEGYKQKKYNFTAVKNLCGHFIEPLEWLKQNNIIQDLKFHGKIINLQENDVLLLIDTLWNIYNQFLPLITEIHSKQGKVYNVLYDLVPLKYADTTVGLSTIKNFEEMFRLIIERSDGILCISQTIADELIEYIELNKIQIRNKFAIGWFHIGCSFNNNKINSENISNEIKGIFIRKTFLYVSTLEPRKRHIDVLNAFDRLWAEGHDYNLCFVGHVGWRVEELLQKIYSHKNFNKKLFHLGYLSDDELTYCYQNAYALIFASITEGFGLPIIEAAQFSLPLILSDIKIFKEIAGENAIYFEAKNDESLAKKIIEFEHLQTIGQIPNSGNIKFNMWKDSLVQIENIIFGNNWYKIY